MSAWIPGSSAPGTLYSSLAGTIIAATVQRSLRWAWVSSDIASSIEQIGETLLHLVGDVERDRLDGRGRVDATRRHEHTAVDDEEVLHVMRTAPFIDHGARGVGPHPRGAEQMPAAPWNGVVDAEV